MFPKQGNQYVNIILEVLIFRIKYPFMSRTDASVQQTPLFNPMTLAYK